MLVLLQTFRLLTSCGPHVKTLVVQKAATLDVFCTIMRLCPNVEQLKLVEIWLCKGVISEVGKLAKNSLVSLRLEKCTFHVSLQGSSLGRTNSTAYFLGSRGPCNRVKGGF